LPTEQSIQVETDDDGLYLPASQELHMLNPVELPKVPVGQAKQDAWAIEGL
jgi:hypothetical protein